MALLLPHGSTPPIRYRCYSSLSRWVPIVDACIITGSIISSILILVLYCDDWQPSALVDAFHSNGLTYNVILAITLLPLSCMLAILSFYHRFTMIAVWLALLTLSFVLLSFISTLTILLVSVASSADNSNTTPTKLCQHVITSSDATFGVYVGMLTLVIVRSSHLLRQRYFKLHVSVSDSL
jgi:hypothetical protein